MPGNLNRILYAGALGGLRSRKSLGFADPLNSGLGHLAMQIVSLNLLWPKKISDGFVWPTRILLTRCNFVQTKSHITTARHTSDLIPSQGSLSPPFHTQKEKGNGIKFGVHVFDACGDPSWVVLLINLANTCGYLNGLCPGKNDRADII